MLSRLDAGHTVALDDPIAAARFVAEEVEVWRDAGGVWLRDLQSRNGTFLNGRQIPPNQPVRLRLDDVLHVPNFAVVLTARFTVEPSWRDFQGGLIAHLARGIAGGERRFEDLPILADALEEAGCALSELLQHLRDFHPREQRCWIVKRLVRGLAVSPGGEKDVGRPGWRR